MYMRTYLRVHPYPQLEIAMSSLGTKLIARLHHVKLPADHLPYSVPIEQHFILYH